MPYFLCTTDRSYGIQLLQGYVVLVGSSQGSTLCLAPEFNLAPDHYAVYYHAEGFWLENRTGDPTALLVNGHPAVALELKPGDKIRSGCLTLLLEHVELPDNLQIQQLAWPPPLPKVPQVDHLRQGAVPPPRPVTDNVLLTISELQHSYPPAPLAPPYHSESKVPTKPEAKRAHTNVLRTVPKPMPLSC
jgi:hypothetical protein